MQNTIEEWRDIVGYEGRYQVSSLGRIRSTDYDRVDKNGKVYKRKGRFLKPQKHSGGYQCVSLGAGNQFFVHRLVALSFLPNQKETVNHKNSNRSDNRLENLEWASQKENNIHARAHGLYDKAYHLMRTPRGEASGLSLLTESQVLEIRKIYSQRRKTQRQIADMFGVSHPTIQKIVYRQTWKHI